MNSIKIINSSTSKVLFLAKDFFEMPKLFVRVLLFLILGSCILFSSFRSPVEIKNAEDLMDELLVSIDKVKSLKFQLKIAERINGKMVLTGSKTKLNRFPRKIYMNVNGPELLWVEGWNNGYALVNPNGFPYINLSLNPEGSLMRDGQHHTIHEIGFEYYGSILKQNKLKAGNEFNKIFKFNGEIKWNNRPCYYLVADNYNFGYTKYTVQKGEDLIKIARKLFLSEYMLLELNKDKMSDYDEAKQGQVIVIPTSYAKRTELYIDKEHLLPVCTKIYDDKGLFESYEYLSLIVNPVFAKDEFSKTYKEYHF